MHGFHVTTHAGTGAPQNTKKNHLHLNKLATLGANNFFNKRDKKVMGFQSPKNQSRHASAEVGGLEQITSDDME